MRTSRKRSESDIYHLIARGTGRQLIFNDDVDRRKLLELLDDAVASTKAELLAWCFMGNHIHLLVRAPIEAISSFMKALCGGYALWFNARAGRTGHLFQERFKSEPVDADGYLLTVIRYIHANPEKAGIASASEYPWSSYSEYAGRAERCAVDLPIGMFGREAIILTGAPDGSERACMDVEEARSATRPMPDSEALALAGGLLDVPVSDVKALPIAKRNEALRAMKTAGLSVRQIERLTGIGRNTVQRA